MIKDGNQYYVIGIHFFFASSKSKKIKMNYAIELNKARIQNIIEWSKQMNKPEGIRFYQIDDEMLKSYDI